MIRVHRNALAFLLALCAFLQGADLNEASAQAIPSMPPQQSIVDAQGTNLALGRTNLPGPSARIGTDSNQLVLRFVPGTFLELPLALNMNGYIQFFRQSPGGGGGTVYARAGVGKTHNFRIGSYNGVSNFNYAIFINQGPYYEEGEGGAWLSCDGDANNLWNNGRCNLYESDGSKVLFDFNGRKNYYRCNGNTNNSNVSCNFINQGSTGWSSITHADGEVVTRSINSEYSAIKSSLGYYGFVSGSGAWGDLEIRLVNAAREYCNQANVTCGVSSGVQSSKYDANANVVYDNGVARFAGMGGGRVKYPSGLLAGGTSVRKSDGTNSGQIRFSGQEYTYSYPQGIPGLGEPYHQYTGIVANPDGTSTSFTIDENGKITNLKDEIGRSFDFTYTKAGYAGSDTIPLSACSPNSAGGRRCLTYTYKHGVVSSATDDPGTGEALSKLQWGVVDQCDTSNYRMCNKPTYFIDAKGNRTDFTYHMESGGVQSVTGPADSNGIRPQKRFTYALVTPRILDSNGNFVEMPQVWRLSRASECLIATKDNPASCIGTKHERVTSYEYDDPNVRMTSRSEYNGDGTDMRTTRYYYDYAGDVISVDGPRSDVDDRSFTTYDVLRRPVFEISADPDGSGPLPRLTVRHMYDVDGREYRTEYGHSTAVDGSDFVVDKAILSEFDPQSGLRIQQKVLIP